MQYERYHEKRRKVIIAAGANAMAAAAAEMQKLAPPKRAPPRNKRYYAVRAGYAASSYPMVTIKSAIFLRWKDAAQFVAINAAAEFDGFDTIEEAEDYLREGGRVPEVAAGCNDRRKAPMGGGDRAERMERFEEIDGVVHTKDGHDGGSISSLEGSRNDEERDFKYSHTAEYIERKRKYKQAMEAVQNRISEAKSAQAKAKGIERKRKRKQAMEAVQKINHGRGGHNNELTEVGAAILSSNPGSLIVLWREYQFGIDGKKAAKLWDRDEINSSQKTKQKYWRRNHVWQAIARLVGGGRTAELAVIEIQKVYGFELSVTKIINEMIKDRQRHPGGIHPNLR